MSTPLHDLTGQRFGMLVALRYHGQVRGRTCWVCRCDCGTERIAVASQLKDGVTWRCGNHKGEDLQGQRFGRVVVVGRGDPDVRGRARWACACDCGEAATILGSSLKSGRTRSCGCLRVERTREWAIAWNEARREAA